MCLACRRLGVTCAACVVRQEHARWEREREQERTEQAEARSLDCHDMTRRERRKAVRVVEGVSYYPFLVRFTLADGRKRRLVRWSPGAPWVGGEVVRELEDRFWAGGAQGQQGDDPKDGAVMKARGMSTGAVVWEGPSRFDRSPIAVVLTWQTANEKTGPMVQAWILRTDIAPADAVRTGADGAICGDCPRKGGHGCYVNAANAPQSVFRTFPKYERLSLNVAAQRLAGARLRIGAYGDPAAVPASVWWTLVRHTVGHTGYTHSPALAPALRLLVMASCDSELEATRWQAHGWRTFRVRALDATGEPEALAPGERVCPASSEGGKRLACAWCLACDGAGSAEGARVGKSIAVVDHSGVQLSRLARLRRSREGAAVSP